MIDQDYTFFRQNFSASSISGQNTPKESYFNSSQSRTPNTVFNNKNKQVVKKQKQYPYKPKETPKPQSQPQQNPKGEGKLGSNWVETGKQGQLKILQKLRTQHQGIKSINAQEGLHQGQYQEEKVDSSQNMKTDKRVQSKQAQHVLHKQTTNKLKSVQATYQQTKQTTKLKQTYSKVSKQLSQLKQSHKQQISVYQSKLSSFNTKIQSLNNQLRDKQALIKRLRNNEAALEQKYTNEVRQFQSQLEDSFETVTILRKQVLQKDNEISELRQSNRMFQSNPELFQVQQQLMLLKNKEKGYLQTIDRLQQQNMSDNYPGISTYVNNRDPVSEISGEIIKLKETIIERQDKWTRKLTQTLQNQRRVSFQQIQKLITNRQGPISFGSEQKIQHVTHKQQVIPILERISFQIQQLKKNRSQSNQSVILQQLKFIKEFVLKLQKNQKQLSHYGSEKGSSDAFELIKMELANYKRFILEQQKSKRAFLEELNLYRSQNLQIINENTYLRHQLGTIQHQMEKTPADNSKYIDEINSLRIQVQQQHDKIQQYQHQVSQLHDQLVNTQPQRPTILNRSQDIQLHNQIQRLHHIMQAQSEYFIKVNTQITQYFESQINLYQQRVRIYEESIIAAQSYLQENQMRLHQLYSRQQTDSNSILQINQMVLQEVNQFRSQLGGLISTNRQIQTQIRERSQSVDQMWRTKQEQLHGQMLMIEKLKGHHQ